MTKRIFDSILGACLIVMFATVITTVFTLYQGFVHEEVTRLEKETQIIASSLNRKEDISGDIEILRSTDIRVCLINSQGIVTYDSYRPDNHEDHSDRQEIEEAKEDGTGFAIRHSKTIAQETYNAAIRLADGSFLRLSQSHSSLLKLFGQSALPLVILIPVLIVFTWFFARLLADHIVGPINAINLSDPLKKIPYEQLRPLLERLDSNNRQIRDQMHQLETKTSEFDALSNSMDEGLLMISDKGKLAFSNKMANFIFNLHPGDLPSDNPQLARPVKKALEGEEVHEILEKNGRIYSLEFAPVLNGEKNIGAIVLALDITEKQEAQKRRQEFTANVTHELKTPLQTISSSAELLSAGLVKPEDIPRFTGYISKEASRMISMVNDIIHLSRLENESSKQTETADLDAVCQKVAEKMEQAASVRKITLIYKGKPALIQGSAMDLESIVKNLVENAIHYNREEGSVSISLFSEKGMAVLKVRDTGIGIPYELQERIFERFYTADPSRSQTGTGLGLAIVNHAVSNLGGSISLKSKPNEGSCFTIRLPLADKKELMTGGSSTSPNEDSSKTVDSQTIK